MEPGSAREADRGSSHVEKSFGGNYLMCQYLALSPSPQGKDSHVLTHPEVNEASIERLVRAFYERAREDPVIGAIFNTSVADWEHHIANITDFWSSIVLRTGRYGGRPMRPHLMLPLRGEHFDRWLMLFESTARELFSAEVAAVFIDRARRIADSFEMGIASTRGEITAPRHSGAGTERK